MRNEFGFEQVSVTDRVLLDDTIGAERYALGWKNGIYHEPLKAEESKFSKSLHRRPKIARYYRGTTAVPGRAMLYRIDGDDLVMNYEFADVKRMSTVEHMEIRMPAKHDSWAVTAVQANGAQFGNWTGPGKVIQVRVKCTDCGTERSFDQRLWVKADMTLGCRVCREYISSATKARLAIKEEDLPKRIGEYELHETFRGQTGLLYVVAICTGPVCRRSRKTFSSTQWLSDKPSRCCKLCAGAVHIAVSEETVQAVLLSIRNGMSQTAAAIAHGVCKNTISRILEKRRTRRYQPAPEAAE